MTIIKELLYRFDYWKKLCYLILSDRKFDHDTLSAYKISYNGEKYCLTYSFNFVINIWEIHSNKYRVVKLKMKELKEIAITYDDMNSTLDNEQYFIISNRLSPIYQRIVGLLQQYYFGNVEKLTDYIV